MAGFIVEVFVPSTTLSSPVVISSLISMTSLSLFMVNPVFSKIDFVCAYYQTPMAEKDIPMTAVTTPFRVIELLRRPFGLRNAARTLQRFIDQVNNGLDFVVFYLDGFSFSRGAPHTTSSF